MDAWILKAPRRQYIVFVLPRRDKVVRVFFSVLRFCFNYPFNFPDARSEEEECSRSEAL